jgi:hypothetical protein
MQNLIRVGSDQFGHLRVGWFEPFRHLNGNRWIHFPRGLNNFGPYTLELVSSGCIR